MYELVSKKIANLFLSDKEVKCITEDIFDSNKYSMSYMRHSDINALAPTFGISNIEEVISYNRLEKMIWLIK